MKQELSVINKDNVENLIYEIRGKQIMLDSDLARLYNCKNGTKEINQAVKNNPLKFPERFSWKLTDEESNFYLVKNFDQINKIETRGGKYKNPRVFTEQGVYMLATILKTPVADDVSMRIMDAFVYMREIVGSNLISQRSINERLLNQDNKIDNVDKKINQNTRDIKLLQKAFDKLNKKDKSFKIFYCGQKMMHIH